MKRFSVVPLPRRLLRFGIFLLTALKAHEISNGGEDWVAGSGRRDGGMGNYVF